MRENYDDRLIRCGAYFLPWKGDQYDQGFNHRKLLILGESHYQEWDGKVHDLSSNFTRKCILETISRSSSAAPLWRSIEQTLLNRARVNGWPPGGEEIWNKVAFYNFVQTPVRSRDIPPSQKQFVESWDAFFSVLDELRPERVLVCGARLWSNMPPTPNERGSKGKFFLRSDIQGYCLADGTPVWCFAIHHPSICFSWSRWHAAIDSFLRDPAEAARLPRPH